MPVAPDDAPFNDDDIRAIFDFETRGGALLAVSGGSDSMALLHLFHRYCDRLLPRGAIEPVVVATVDHGLRPEATEEAQFVAGIAAKLGMEHVTLRWSGEKPRTGLQEAARAARYALLIREAERRCIETILTGHTLDDQAETVLMRLARGSGLKGLGAMQRCSQHGAIRLVRPFLSLSRERLRATLLREGIVWVDDPSNADPRFLRPRLRQLMPLLAQEGLDAVRLANIAHQMRRADEAIERAVEAALAGLLADVTDAEERGVRIERSCFARLPAEVGMRVLARLLIKVGASARHPSDVQLESLVLVLRSSGDDPPNLRRTLHGALISAGPRWIRISRAPPRRNQMSG